MVRIEDAREGPLKLSLYSILCFIVEKEMKFNCVKGFLHQKGGLLVLRVITGPCFHLLVLSRMKEVRLKSGLINLFARVL